MAMIVLDAITSSFPAPTHAEDEGLALAIVADQQPMAVDECDDPETEVDFVPLRVKRKLPPDSHSDESDKNDDSAPMRKRGRPARAKSAKSEAWRKQEFGYSDNNNTSSSESESESEGNKDDDYDPMVKRTWPADSMSDKSDKDDNFAPTGKRGRPARGKSAKSDNIFVFNISSSESESESESEGNKDDDDYDPTAVNGEAEELESSAKKTAQAVQRLPNEPW